MSDILPELTDIRRSNILTVFEAISRGGRVTRAEISAVTGLSQVTVGKSTAVLSESGVIEMSKRPSGQSAGRHTAVCFVSEKRKLFVLDLSGEAVRMTMFGLSLKEIRRETHEFELAEAMCLRRLLELGEELAGVVCVLPDERRGAASERAYGFISRMKTFRKPDAVLSAVEASSIYHAEKCGGSIIFLKETSDSLAGAVVKSGEPVRLAHGGVAALYRMEGSAARVGAVLSIATGVGVIFLECLSKRSDFQNEVSGLFENADDAPEAAAEVFRGEDGAAVGAAAFLRRRWLGGLSGAER